MSHFHHVHPDVAFRHWMRDVDRLLVKKCGLTSDDLPDCLYRDWFDDGVTPARAAAKAISAAKEG